MQFLDGEAVAVAVTPSWWACVALLWLGLWAVPAGAEPESVYAFEAQRLSGDHETLARYRGVVLLIVNTASRCGYTPQLEGLEALYQRYRARGFSVLGFPSNDFAQEPGSDAQIENFCRREYGVTFPMFTKLRVTGVNAHPLYAWLAALPAPLGGPVEWNFQKFLVDREGRVSARFAPSVSPSDPALASALERLLAGTAP